MTGESFEKMASELSEAPSKANAGLIGPLSVTDLSADLQKLLEPMKTGDITQPLRAQRGYQILKLESATSAQTKSFDEARDDISNRVFADKRRDEFEKYLQKMRSQAIIEWKNDDVKKAYDQGLAAPRTEQRGPLRPARCQAGSPRETTLPAPPGGRLDRSKT